MHIRSFARRLIGVNGIVVEDIEFIEEGIVVVVRPRKARPRCPGCCKRAAIYDRRSRRCWRHLSYGSTRVWLSYAPRRTSCKRCGIHIEQVPWAVGRTGFTEDFEELVAYLAQATDKTTVTKLMGISWSTVGKIAERVVARRLDSSRLDDLVVIGIDEFSYRKRHRYVTVVVDHDRSRIVWAAEGKSSDTLGSFFETLGEERRDRILAATIDLGGAYIKALREWLPNAVMIFDRFHVQRLASDAVDEVRRDEVRRLSGGAAASVKNTRFVLLKNPWNLSRAEKQRLSQLQNTNKRVYRAYLLKETLAAALDTNHRGRAARAIKDWAAWAMRSRLEPFKRLARTIRKHIIGILNYVENPYTNSIVEGFNNRMRMVARRAFGYHSARALIAMMFLCCGGIQLTPPLP